MFKDSKGRVLFRFSREVNVDLVVYTEVLGFREGLLMVTTSRWALADSFVF